MGVTIGIRREDKSKWERRVPLVPADVSDLRRAHGLDFIVQPSPIRVFGDDEYTDAGATVAEDLDQADIVLAVKEIPLSLLWGGKAYVYFSHTVKAQAYNMPMLRHVLDVGATLIDYERIADEQGRRLIFFSVEAGHAGMIETLWAMGRRLEHQGRVTPLTRVRRPFEYASLDEAMAHLREIGTLWAEEPPAPPLVVGIAGYGNVSRGAQEILACLPVAEVAVADLPGAAAAAADPSRPLVKVVFREEDMVEPRSAEAHFVLQDYYQRPENYRGVFHRHLPHLDALVNTIYWEDRYPRLVTRGWVRDHYGAGRAPRLQVIGDISCDIEGSIELTLKATQPDAPCYIFDPATGGIVDGVAGDGIVIMAVDNLPCELPREASTNFSTVLREMVPELARADFGADFPELQLPGHLKRAVVAHRGALAPDYRYLQEHLDSAGA